MSQLQKIDSEQDFIVESEALIKSALEHVLVSSGFEGSPRLQDFLRYIVSETLEGRGADIRGKSVAVDVYGRKLEKDAGLNLVSVEARRLRRLLAEYNAGEGKDAPVHIVVDPGGYHPRFEVAVPQSMDAGNAEVQQGPAPAERKINPSVLVGGGVIAALIVLVAVLWRPVPEEALAVEQHDPARVALREHSMLSLQAKNMAQQAQGMLFPVFDLKRQELALGMFRHAIDLDASLPDGHAGEAQTLAVIGLFSPDREAASDARGEAFAAAQKALDIAPTNAWANGAMAFVLAARQEPEDALKHARIALELAPEDGHVLDLVGMAAIMADDAALAARASDPKIFREGVGRFGSRNIWAVSQLMLQNYPETVAAFQGAAAAGAPVSPPSLLFQAVAFDQMAEPDKAQALMAELNHTWPHFPAAFVVNAMFADGSHVEKTILSVLQKVDN
ncbi:hypothetical protein [uncultured Shimia sp.]|uniref:hypothetical protein n=1 Tax=uncultured Shimia sp. TaxID=573152 RepID=UPI00263822A2|nr:hypothetical protein [uncultured Shimia sp.]